MPEQDRSEGSPSPGSGGEPAEAEASRREFLKKAGAAGLAFASSGLGLLNLTGWSGLPQQPLAGGVIFPDPTLCIGCLTCEVICSRVHKEQGLSDVPRIRIVNDPTVRVDPEIQRHYPDRGQYHQEPCLQCPTAECVYVCPVDAFKIEPRTQARYIDESTCVSCGRCATACPFPISDESLATNQLAFGQKTRITYDPQKDTFAKCDLCYWRPEGPACVERCPVNIRIKQGLVKSDRLCLDAPPADQATWDRLRAFQTFPGSLAPGV